jgi:hypothetical protein
MAVISDLVSFSGPLLSISRSARFFSHFSLTANLHGVAVCFATHYTLRLQGPPFVKTDNSSCTDDSIWYSIQGYTVDMATRSFPFFLLRDKRAGACGLGVIMAALALLLFSRREATSYRCLVRCKKIPPCFSSNPPLHLCMAVRMCLCTLMKPGKT